MKKAYKYAIAVLLLISAALFTASFFKEDPAHEMQSEASRMQRHLHKREMILNRYCRGLLEGTATMKERSDLPEDMVIYLYRSDTLSEWINEFPIASDAIRPSRGYYRLHHLLASEQIFSSPLAYLDGAQDYVNLGSAWYYVKVWRDGRDCLIGAILIKNEYPLESMSYANETNPRLHLKDKYTTVPLHSAMGITVSISDGTPIFSVVENFRSHYSYGYYPLHWAVIMLLLVAAFLYHLARRSRRSLAVYAVLITALILWARHLGHICDPSGTLFSPLTYAGNNLLDSLCSLLVSNTYIFMLAMGMFIIRVPLLQWYRKLQRRSRRLCAAASITVTVLLFLYINYTLRSLIYNSNINLNLERIYDINIYSIVSLATYALLFVVLLHAIQLCVTTIAGRRVTNIYNWKYFICYLLVVALYCTTTIYSAGIKKEISSNRLLTERLSIDRDLSLEVQLRAIEPGIAGDQIIAILSFWQGNSGEIIRNRILERYLFRSFSSRYNITVTTCNPATQLIVDRNTPALNCLGFYSEELRKYGVPLSLNSHFFFLNNFSGHACYLGVFTYVNYDTMEATNLYIEIESRFRSGKGTNMSEILSHQSLGPDIPPYYSYAKYCYGRLVAYSGSETFPTEVDMRDYRDGYYLVHKGKMLQFINKVSDDDLVILSRPVPSFLRHIILFCYLFILMSAIIVPSTSHLRKSKLFTMPRNTYKRRITGVMLISVGLSLLCVGAGTIWFTVQRNRKVNERNMVRNMEIVQSTLSEYCQYALRYTDINTPQLQEAMKSISSSTGNDINIYDTHGVLLCTTRPELFNNSILGLRMDHAAYRAIAKENYLNYVCAARIVGNSFQSIYAPLYNIDGDMVAIANIPHVTEQTQFQMEGAMIVSSIINLYLLMLLLSTFLSVMLADSISKPLTKIRNSMTRLPGSRKKEHLVYREGKDELGMLVAAYNRMVVELDESTRLLARTERETAWKGMARTIAHEIKNPLTPMKLSIQHLQRLKRNNAPDWEEKFDKTSATLLEQIEILTRAATDFSSLSKLFSDEEVSREDLLSMLKKEAELFLSAENFTISVESDLESAPIDLRKQQVLRAFTNLISNASQAIGNRDGRVVIRLGKEDGDYLVSVEDNGPGVSDENIPKLFSGNFTTKTDGSGLGLCICRDIFEQNGGSIRYERSALLGGASFVVTLPACKVDKP